MSEVQTDLKKVGEGVVIGFAAVVGSYIFAKILSALDTVLILVLT